jgi:membrane-associated phospholipid phosphatase
MKPTDVGAKIAESLEPPPMTALVSAGRRVLPRGWADLGRQLAIWFGFLAAYQVARGIADRNPPKAFDNGLHVIGIERHAHALIELTLQRLVDGSQVLSTLASWTYWNSEFTVLGVALLWVYLRRNEAFVRFRNTILLANIIGLIGYVLLPTAPPRMFPDLGFADTLTNFGELNHGSGLVEFAANPYAAMPSLHAADALIVGLVLFSVCRTRPAKTVWLLWPAWVWFSVMATGNHFWLDVVAGVVVATISGVVVYRRDLLRRRPKPVTV